MTFFIDTNNEDGENFDYDVTQAAINHSKVLDALNNLDEISSEKRSSRREQCVSQKICIEMEFHDYHCFCYMT